MSSYRIGGGIPLNGEVQIQGSKNAALPIMAASILRKGITCLHRCPKIADVFLMQKLLQQLGCETRWDNSCFFIDSRKARNSSLHNGGKATVSMRSTITLLGALLGRFGSCEMEYPGGCVIGARPIDMHIQAMSEMGTEFVMKEGSFLANAPKLHGADICLRFASVGVTENILLAAACAEGETKIVRAAREPEVDALCEYLSCIGCKIWFGDSGVDREIRLMPGELTCSEVEFTIPTDRIVAGTYLFACVGTGGTIYLKGAQPKHLEEPLRVIEQMGALTESSVDGIFVKAPRNILAQHIITGVYPEFPTDLQSPAVAALCHAQGDSMVQETIFENRFRMVEELNRMGADILVRDSRAFIRGNRRLHGRRVVARELRGGAALVIAGLMAEGITRIEDVHYIERGYENICRDLRDLGARISIE